MGVMGVSLISPVLPELRHVFDVSDAQIGLIITTFAFPGIFVTPFIGLAADRFGRKRVLIPLLVLFGVSGGAIAFITDFLLVLGLRFLQGIGATALVMLAVTLIGDIYEGTQLDAVIGVNGSVIGIGAAFYPLIGGGLAVIAWNVPFLLFGLGVVVGIFAIVVLDEPTSEQRVGFRTYLDRLSVVVRLPRALAIFSALFAAVFLFYGAVITALPLLLSDEFGLTSGLIGPVLAVVSLANATTASQYGRLTQLRTGPELVALGFVAFGFSLLLVWFATSVYVIAAAMLVFGVGIGVIFPSVDTMIISLVSDDLRAGMMGIRTSMIRVGQTLGPAGFTFFAESFFLTTAQGYRTMILLAGGIAVIGAGVAYLVVSR